MKKIATFLFFVLSACSVTKKNTILPQQPSLVIQGKIFATAYMQRAAEYKALCLQAYNLAHLRLDQYLAQPAPLPPAIITDIDETVLDNSAFEVHQTLQGKDYEPAAWSEWSAKTMADTIAGAPAFLKYAASKGVQIFYITNREEKEKTTTINNLRLFGLPNADAAHVVPRQSSSSKEDRRKNVMAHFNVILLLGDNLADFSAYFDKKTLAERDQNVNKLASLFGDHFIVLPNPVYGDWESAIYNYQYNLTQNQKDSIIRSSLKKSY